MRERASRGVAWITGASSGIGRATALALAESGFAVAATSRRADVLDRLVAEIAQRGGTALAVPGDVADEGGQRAAIALVERELGRVSVAVLAAGLNSPKRFWNDVEMPRFREIVDTNLLSVASAVRELAPRMRRRGGGQFVFVSSWSAWRHAPGAGVAYAVSKTGLGVLAETVNAQLGRDGVRACHLCPGDVDTAFLDQRPSEVSAAQRARMLSPDAVARAIRFVAESPGDVCVNELVLTPTANAAYAHG